MHGPYDVLVGVDGSLESKDALVWAVTEARSRHTRLTVGYVCEAAAYGLWTTTRTIRAGLRELSQPIIDEAVAQARRLDPEISVRGRVVLGSPSRSLLSLSAGSQLIVVGRQGKGALATHLLGSVSQRLMAHALCPVVAVSHPREGGLGIGVALIAGVAVRIATVSGVLMMAFMWLADFPLAQHTSAGTPSGSVNPLVDYHLIYAIVLVVLAATYAGTTWGLGRIWAKLPFVSELRWTL